MITYRQAQHLLFRIQKVGNQGFTIIDFTAFLLVIGILVTALPIFLNSSATGSSLTFRNRATLSLRSGF